MINKSNANIFIVFFLCFYAKIIILYSALQFDFLSTLFLKGLDADTYHQYAIGYLYDKTESNFWFWFLKKINDLGFYNRQYVLYFLIFINTVLLPIVFYSLIKFEENRLDQRILIAVFIFLTFYPSILYHSLDIFRDIFMLYIFMLGLFFTKKSSLKFNSYFLIAVIFGLWLFWLRAYLGFSYLVALFFCKYFDINKNFILKINLYLILLFSLNYIGAFDPLIEYRNWFLDNDANTNLKIDFNNKNYFLFSFSQSAVYQLFGFYFNGFITFLLFIFESLLFIGSLSYVIINRRFLNEFLNFCFLFFIFYSTLWLISNDNFGTAIRLRWFSYFPIYISALIIYQIKKGSKK